MKCMRYAAHTALDLNHNASHICLSTLDVFKGKWVKIDIAQLKVIKWLGMYFRNGKDVFYV